MQNECRLSIITVNYNGQEDTCALLSTIPSDRDIEIIVVDNGSRVDETQTIAQRFPHVTTIRSEQNLGFAGGNNLGIKASHGKYLFFINNDTEFRGEWMADRLMQRLDEHAETAIVCPKIRFAWGTSPIQFAGFTPLSSVTLRNQGIGYGEEDHGQHDTPHSTPYAHGAAMLVSREAIKRVGLMPECYFLYYEEVDWSIMMTRAGYDIWYDPSCTIYHKESRSTGIDSPLKCYYLTRNRFLLAKRNIGFPTRLCTYFYLITIVLIRDILKHLLKKHWQQAQSALTGVADFCRGRIGKRQIEN
ncbi:MAG: glycosyltransferase family 2 protein [Prevotella sp.]|nr:glycosyltransferase family 2 protein [Prevotella sp.]